MFENLIDNKVEKSVTQKELDKISRNVLIWLNKFPEIPVSTGIIKYEVPKVDVPNMVLSTIQGTYIQQKDILGRYKAQYQFKIIYRLKPGGSMDKRLNADELLNSFGAWASDNIDALNLGDGVRAKKIESTQSTLFAMYENGDEDHQILMNLTYEVI